MRKMYLIIAGLFFCYHALAQPVISGPLNVCATFQVTLTATPAGCTWSSSNPTIATIGSSTGVVTGGTSGGVCTITYNCGSSGFSTVQFTVDPAPATIVCPTSGCNVCLGGTITVTDPTPGGVWSTQTPSIATVGSASGVVTGVSLGTTILTYALVPTGCFVTSPLTVMANPSAITGTNVICVGQSTTLTATPPLGVPPGTWSGSPVTTVSVNPTSGVVTGIGAGVATITYMLGYGCYSTYTVTVNPTPGPISCPSTSGCNVCVGSSITLTCPPVSGTWSSSNPSIATIGSSSGILTGVAPGSVVVTYALPTGCSTSVTVVVNPNPGPITGTTTICTGATTALSCSPGGGSWSSSNTAVGTVTGTGVVTGLSAGVTTITYMLGTGCFSVVNVTVNPSPGPISCGSTGLSCSICVGGTTTLFNPVAGGIWSSSNTGIATVGSSSGVVTGISPGVVTIAYTLPGGCFTSITLTVNPNPGPITGTTTICTGTTTTLSCSPGGGTWSSSNTAVGTVTGTGVVTGLSAGVTTITYMLGTGCYSVVNVTVNQTPIIAGVSGIIRLCVGQTTTLTGIPTGGIWTSSNTTVATVGSSSGLVTAISPGTTIITYSLAGCSATITLSVNPNPGTITGTTTICAGSTTTLNCTPSGGTWSSSNIAVGTVSGTGVVTGLSAGVTTITYTLSTGCFSTVNVTVNPTPIIAGVSGIVHVCVGQTLSLTGSPTGGIWSSGNVTIATVGASSGIVTGIAPGTTVITYSLGGCAASVTITVNPNPGPITGVTAFCVGSGTILSASPTGGIWSSACSGVTVGSSSGSVVGVSAGVCTITYTLPTGCFATINVTVNPVPTISGALFTCVGATTTLTGLPAGGIFSSGNPSVGTVGASTGIVTGVSPGTTPITYTLSTGCSVTVIVTVTPAPGPIACPSLGCMVCQGNTMLLTNPIPGGSWSSSNTGIATVGSGTGVVTGVSAGTSYITYTLGGCFVTTLITVNPLPAVFAVTGGGSYCAGGAGVLVGLAGSQPGVNYQLYCGLSPVGPAVAGTGAAISFGLQTGACTYTVIAINAFGCTANMSGSATVTVNPMPLPIVCPISGCMTCVGTSVALTDPTTGGAWSSSNPAVGTIGSASGIVTGIAAGVTIITYTLPGGCYVTTAFTVNPAPTPITGPTTVCTGSAITLSNATPGGTWSAGCANLSVNSTSGVVTGVGAGPCTVTYTLPGGCYATYNVTVNQTPGPIAGPTSVCVTYTITLTNPNPGGTWSTSCGNATVVATSGVVTGVAAGACNITYTLPGGCYVTYAITVNPLPCVQLEVDETANAGTPGIFPNPANDELTIRMNGAAFTSFTITNSVGQVVMTRQFTGKEMTIDIRRLPPAVYNITLRGDGGIAVQRFVKE